MHERRVLAAFGARRADSSGILPPLTDGMPPDAALQPGRGFRNVDSDLIATVEKKPLTPGNEQSGGIAGTTDAPGLRAFVEFDSDAAEKIERQRDGGKRGANGEALDLPSIMNDNEVDAAAAMRRREPHNPYTRTERPDPWPIIERTFPRIAATIRAQWGRRSLDDYFAKLVVDDRGGRQGFPPDVLIAILEVARLHGEQYRFAKPLHPWETDVSDTKWWNRGS